MYGEGAMSDSPSTFNYTFAMLSDVGRVRSGNEDCCAAEPEHGIFIVCDGMGGAAAGEVASRLAVEEFIGYMKAARRVDAEALLQSAADAANARVHEYSKRPGLRGMGTTLVALTAFPEGALWLTHVGDSRCYRLRGGELLPLTRDHSFVEEQVLSGRMTPEQAERSPMRNIITRAIGAAPTVWAEVRRLGPELGDLYLLASDGLTRELAEAEVAALLGAALDGDLDQVCRALIEAANAAGGHDNVTVLLLRVEA